MLTPEERETVKGYYNEYCSKKDAIKEMNKDCTEDVKSAAEIMNRKPADVKKVFDILKKREEGGNDTLDTMNEIILEIEG